MKLAICNETFQDWPLAKGFAFARECGYTGIEIAPFTLASPADSFDVSSVSVQRRGEIRRQAEEAGLEVVGLHWLLAKTSGYHLTSPDPDQRRATADYLVALARLCRDLGGTIMVFGSPQQRNLMPGVTPEAAMSHAAEVLTATMPACSDLGVTIALEPLAPAEGDFMLTAASAVELIEMVQSPNCRLHLDCKAMSSETASIPEIIRANKDHLVHFHANDPNMQGPGMGALDFAPILAALREIDYQGWLSVEVFDYSPGVERLATESINYLQQVLRDMANA